MRVLDGAMRYYAWGSRSAIAAVQGRRVPSAHPEAELWFGAHPGDPARVLGDDGAAEGTLLDVVEDDPVAALGERSVDRFGARLPYLLKLLAAEEPLSLQAHPSSVQAAEGFEAENVAGLPLDAADRNYKDPSHKPELVVALTPFEALAGFRDPKRTVDLLAALAAPELEPYVSLLAEQPDSGGLRALFTTWITLPPNAVSALMPKLLDACVALLASDADGEYVREARTALQLAEAYPGDSGVFASLLLNRVSLEPGEGLYLPAGNLHAYLHGVGIEIMANSDNVLRGGLTPKHVDVPELLRVLDFDAVDVPLVEPRSLGDGEYVYDTPAPEFALARIELGAGAHTDLTERGPRIVLVTFGRVRVTCGGSVVDLPAGHAVWVADDEPDIRIDSDTEHAQVFLATTAQDGGRGSLG
ncbi:mannose-6-phosphate isomerase, class I [Rhodococcus rhodnii]|uniref:mannose-6-phosphate isomerase n=2 Tax=Rhodococcus rhodnii TaxID=38312 RepID=R7WN13_9NOCA|nr:mannose-6-phosphate isomerase, class I [Rhodococcus rhodnii]EOM75374.1 mannose-6-phosphate isomerase [Rhodococcus rhodnii LMG 5362]TXG90580.1 mannose-6-phosphate isomerase, class I [Rhodococcus rhodnii]